MLCLFMHCRISTSVFQQHRWFVFYFQQTWKYAPIFSTTQMVCVFHVVGSCLNTDCVNTDDVSFPSFVTICYNKTDRGGVGSIQIASSTRPSRSAKAHEVADSVPCHDTHHGFHFEPLPRLIYRRWLRFIDGGFDLSMVASIYPWWLSIYRRWLSRPPFAALQNDSKTNLKRLPMRHLGIPPLWRPRSRYLPRTLRL